MTSPSNDDITRILNAVNDGRGAARIRLLDLIYHELHRLAGGLMRGERADHTLQPTALIHETYIRLLGSQSPNWANRAHFFGAAAEAMRRILIDHARERNAAKRGGGKVREEWDPTVSSDLGSPEELLDINDVLTEFEALEPRKATVVKLRFFAGMTFEEIAAVLDVSPITAKRDWRFARAWLASRTDAP